MAAYKRFIAAWDIHGDEQDKKANEALFSFVDVWKPQIRVCGGDLWNFVALRKGASQEEKEVALTEDYNAGSEWLERFKATDFLLGNHDYRLWKLAEDGKGVMKDYAQEAVRKIEEKLHKNHCKSYRYDRREGVLRLGHLKLIHGFVSGVNAARRSALTYGSVLMGHGHGIQHVSIEGLDNRMGRMCGCLCNLNMDYVHASIASLMWRHGFSYGVVNETTGDYATWQAESVNGKWILPSDIVCL